MCQIPKKLRLNLTLNQESCLDQRRLNTINNSDINNTYKDLYLSGKEREEKLLQVIQAANGLKK